MPAKSEHRTNIAAVFAAREAERKANPSAPTIAPALASTLIALSVLILNFSIHLPVVPILILFAMWLPWWLVKARHLLDPRLSMLATFAMPLLCLASTLWSDYPKTTAYLGTAFVVFALCIWVMARAVDFASLIKGLVFGLSATLVITLIDGTIVIDRDNGAHALTGPFGSKNMVGLMAELCIIATLAYALHAKRLWLIFPIALSVYCLALSHSASALVTLVLTLLIGGCAWAAGRGPKAWRILALMVSMLLIGTVAIAALSPNISSRVLESLGKKPTLTGRTYLWSQGMEIAKERPLLGHGYSAFWVKDNPQAERYWDEFYIRGRSGFHFHQSWIQAGVDLGLVGAGLLTLLIATNCVLSVVRLVQLGARPDTLFLLGLSFMFLMRGFVEIDYFSGPFGVGVMLFYMLTPRLAQLRKNAM